MSKIADKIDAPSFIACFLVISLIGITFLLLVRPTVADNDLTKILIGGLMTVGFATVINFYFGSNRGSQAKDQTIADMAKSTPPSGEPPNPPVA